MVNKINNTIYALSSGQGKAGVAVIRISGSNVRDILFQITGKNDFQPRLFFTSEISDPFKKVLIDFSLVVYFAGPDSFTGEDVGELHIHGGYSVIKSALEMLGQFSNTRLAYPGEFTRRAFTNNKFDLTGAEAIADLLNAETEIQRLQALGQMGGGLSKFCFKWKEDLVKSLSFQEVLIDFSFDDIPDNLQQEVNDLVKSVYESICEHLQIRSGEKIRDGLSVVILGEPNVGKSSLMNNLTKTESAIVSSIAGTTRDIIEVRMDLFGILVNFFDTAGLRNDSIDPIEKIGIERAKKKAINADIKVFIFSPDNLKLNDNLIGLIDKKTILVMNKCDLIDSKYDIFARFKEVNFSLSDFIDNFISTSIVDNFGINDLLDKISEKARGLLNVESSSIITQERHRQALLEVKKYLHNFLFSDLIFPEIQAEHLRLALFNLGKITGDVDVEELFDIIFSSFCLGK